MLVNFVLSKVGACRLRRARPYSFWPPHARLEAGPAWDTELCTQGEVSR